MTAAKKSKKINLPLDSAVCESCGKAREGIKHEGYLWPGWMMNGDAQAFVPHGPRIFNFNLMKCWVCAAKDGESWFR